MSRGAAVSGVRGQLLKGARVASRAAGRATASSRMLPAFLIVGAQRCGTTSMFKTLRQHPAVLAPALQKGIHYFDKNYDRGPALVPQPLPAARDRPARVEGRGRRRADTGESSPYYMFHPLAGRPDRGATCPASRLIVLLRDPVERAYLGVHAREGARLRDRDRSSARSSSSRRGSPARRSGCSPTRRTTASTCSTTPT